MSSLKSCALDQSAKDSLRYGSPSSLPKNCFLFNPRLGIFFHLLWSELKLSCHSTAHIIIRPRNYNQLQKYLRHCTVFWHKWPVLDLVLVIPLPPLIQDHAQNLEEQL